MSHDKRNEKICTMRLAGLTTAQIGRQLGITRSTVCGVLHRAGLTNARKGRPRTKPPKADRPLRQKVQIAMARKIAVTDVKAIEIEPIPLGTDSGCQWVHGDPRDRVMCGHTTHRHSSWCPHHYRRVYQEVS